MRCIVGMSAIRLEMLIYRKEYISVPKVSYGNSREKLPKGRESGKLTAYHLFPKRNDLGAEHVEWRAGGKT